MSIDTFMTWFIEQCITIFTYTYNTLANITFGGINLLMFSIAILVLSALLPVFLTLPGGTIRQIDRATRKEKK